MPSVQRANPGPKSTLPRLTSHDIAIARAFSGGRSAPSTPFRPDPSADFFGDHTTSVYSASSQVSESDPGKLKTRLWDSLDAEIRRAMPASPSDSSPGSIVATSTPPHPSHPLSRIPIASYRRSTRTRVDPIGGATKAAVLPCRAPGPPPRKSSLRVASPAGNVHPSRTPSPIPRSPVSRRASSVSSVDSFADVQPTSLADLFDRRGSAVSSYSQSSGISASESIWDIPTPPKLIEGLEAVDHLHPKALRERLADVARKHNQADVNLAEFSARMLRTQSVELAVEEMMSFR